MSYLKHIKLDDNVPDFIRHSQGAAGYDLYSTITIPSFREFQEPMSIPTGIILEIPEKHVGLLTLRSSFTNKLLMPFGTGIIDSDFRGEIKFIIEPRPNMNKEIPAYTRIGQIVILPCYTEKSVMASETSYTHRGTNGFGSTG